MNSVPYEVVAGSGTLYVAVVGTAFPDVDEAPGGAWVKIGSSGDLNYDRGEGIVVGHPQSVIKWRSAGDTGSRKAFRTEEDITARMKLVDLTVEQYMHAMNYNAITTVAAGVGTPGSKAIGLSRGNDIATRALLIRFNFSPYLEDGNSQYEIYRAQQVGNAEPAFAKPGEPAGLILQFDGLVDTTQADPTHRFGRYVAQTAAATS